MLNNKPRGIFFNRNAANIQVGAAANNINQLATGRPADSENNLDNLKAAAATVVAPTGKNHQQSENDNNLFSKQQLLQSIRQQHQQFRPTDENYGVLPKKIVVANNNTTNDAARQPPTGRESPNEPSPPKLRSYSRNSLRQHLPNQQQQPQEDEALVDLSDEPPKQTNEPPKQRAIKQIIDLVEPLRPAPQLEDKQQQESIISRIPRLSLKFPVAPLLNNQRQPAAQKPARINIAQLAAMPEAAEMEEEIEDIDKSTSRDAIYLVCDIAKDIYEYMYQLEEAQAVKEDYLRDQKIFTPKVRQRLINWCIEIHSKLNLLPETLYMTIAVIDRFFERVPVKQQSQVQLVAVGATLIASKYEEIYPPDVGDLIHLTQNSYSRREIFRIEIYILQQLDFDLGKPIPLAFLRRYSKAAKCDLKMHSIAKYLMELSLTEYECAHWPPSQLAAAALFTTIHLVHSDQPASIQIGGSTSNRRTAGGGDRWNKALVHYTHYTRKQLQEPAGSLCKILKRTQKNPQSYACVKKYQPSLAKWPELKSTRVDELIKLGDQV